MLTERHINLLLLAFASVILVSMLSATIIADSITGLDGTVGTIDHQSLWDSLDAFTGSVYLFGDWGCHQETARSFSISGSQMPVCVRETMMVAGVILGCIILHFIPSVCPDSRIAVLLSFVIGCSSAFEWLAPQYLGLNNLFLVELSGMLTGIGGASLLYCLVKAEVRFLNKE